MATDNLGPPPTAMGDVQALTKDQSSALLPYLKKNTPQTLSVSTGVKAVAHTQASPESSETNEYPTSPTDDYDMTTNLVFMEPDPETTHPNVDLSDRNNLVRLLALYQSGWIQGRGHEPRDHEICIWCRGPVTPSVEVLTHVGSSNSCRNSWPATCLLGWIDQTVGAAKNHPLQCPMCREFFYIGCAGPDFRAGQGGLDAEHVISAAWVRCILFGPEYAREYCVKKGKPLIIIRSEEARKLVLLDREKQIFRGCENLSRNVPFQLVRLLHGLKATYPFHKPGRSSTSTTLSTPTTDAPVEKKEAPPKAPLDIVWVLLDWGNNQFRMSPLLAPQAHVLKALTEEQGGVVKPMNADEFARLAKANGGLEKAVKSFRPDDGDELAAMKASGREWLIEMRRESSKDEDHASDKEWYQIVAYYYQAGLDPGIGGIDHLGPLSPSTDADDEWEDSDVSLPEPLPEPPSM